MKKAIYTSLLAMFVLSFTSCTKNLDELLVGTWMVTQIKYEPASGSTTTREDAGTITFLGDGTGSYSIDFYGNGQPVTGSHTWSAADNNETVAISAGLLNPVSGQYTVLTNKKKLQVWQQINSAGDKYTYTLEK